MRADEKIKMFKQWASLKRKAKRRRQEKETKAKRRRQEKEAEKDVTRIPNWLELPPDLLRCIFERLSLPSLNQSRLVCSSWYCASKDCVPNQNQVPWLILFRSKRIRNQKRCMFFVPEDKEKVYRSRDLGIEFALSKFVITCGSWLLLMNHHVQKLYILNPFTGEKIDLPNFKPSYTKGTCFWIDNKTKDYLVVMTKSGNFIRKGYNNWQNLDCCRWCDDLFYSDKNQKLYLRRNRLLYIWDFSRDIPKLDGSVSLPPFNFNSKDLYWMMTNTENLRMAVTVSEEILMVSCIRQRWPGTWYFNIYKRNEVDNNWVKIYSLGDQALIYELGITVMANRNIPGIKRNSIYFNSISNYNHNPYDTFVYDLSTRKVERVLSSIRSLSQAHWFIPF